MTYDGSRHERGSALTLRYITVTFADKRAVGDWERLRDRIGRAYAEEILQAGIVQHPLFPYGVNLARVPIKDTHGRTTYKRMEVHGEELPDGDSSKSVSVVTDEEGTEVRITGTFLGHRPEDNRPCIKLSQIERRLAR